MVIVGVLILLTSLKMRSRNRAARLKDLFNDRQSLPSVATIARKKSSHDIDSFDSHSVDNNTEMGLLRLSIPDRAWLLTPCTTGNPRELDSYSPNDWLLSYRNGTLKTGQLGNNFALSDTTNNNDNTNNEDWTPADGYGEGHQAAIETALSTVLTVSTLVGFRGDQASHKHCCLHHAVQLTKVSGFFDW